MGFQGIGRARGRREPVALAFVVEAISTHVPLAWVQQAIARAGRQSRRRRTLPVELMAYFVILMGLLRRHSYQCLLGKLAGSRWAQQAWSRMPSTSAVTQARDRLGVEPMRLLFEHVAGHARNHTWGMFVAGRRVFTLDGLCEHAPDTPDNQPHFGRSGSSRGRTAFPQMRAVTLNDAGSRTIIAQRCGAFAVSEQSLNMHAAAAAAKADPLRLSFVFCLHRLHEAIDAMPRLPTTLLPQRYRELLALLPAVRVPKRPGRHVTRAVCVKMSAYPLKRKNAA